MRVICIANTGESLPEAYKEQGYFAEYKFPLLIGKRYIPYGMTLRKGKVNYLIQGESRRDPDWMPSELFEVFESKISRCWHYGVNDDKSEATIDNVWGYQELIDASNHFDQLVDGGTDALEVFLRYKEYMDLEFPDFAISDFAEVINDSDWLFCPKCLDAWESRSKYGMVRCAVCQRILRNPRYVEV